MNLRTMGPALMIAGSFALTGCVKQALLAAGSTVASGVTSAASATVGAAGSATSSVAKSGLNATSKVSASSAPATAGTVTANTVATPTATANIAATPASANIAAAPAATTASSQGAANTALASVSATTATGAAAAVATAPNLVVADGVDACLAAKKARVAAGENLAAAGWSTKGHVQTPAAAVTANNSRAQAIGKYGVRGALLADGSCVFRTEQVALTQTAASVHDHLTKEYDGYIKVGSPHGRTGTCDGYTLNAPGLKAWIYFTSAEGDHCSRGGSGVTVKML